MVSSVRFLSSEWLMVLFLYNPLGVTDSIGPNSHVAAELNQSKGKVKVKEQALRQGIVS